MAVVVFGLSFQREAETLPPHRHDRMAEGDASGMLTGLTAIFRLAFRAMLSDVRIFEVPRKRVEAAGASIEVSHCCAFRVSTADIEGRSAPDFLLVTILEISPNSTDVDARTIWQSFRTVERKIALLDQCGLKKVVQSYSPAPGKTVGQNSFVVPVELEPDSKLLSSVFAFYFLAWLTSLRIERSQLRTELTVGRKAVAASALRIANQRLRILNLSRYFLTKDRTNDATIKALCEALSAKFKLQERYERALSLHREFEHHLDNVAKIIQSQQMGSVSNLLLILTLLSVPVSFFGAVIAINLQSDIFKSPSDVITNPTTYLILIVGFFASLIPFSALKLRDWIRARMDRRD
jgi:hypothetical protein